MKTDTHFSSYLSQFFLESITLQTNVVHKIKEQHFMFNIIIIIIIIYLFILNRPVCEIMWKNFVEPEATDESMAHAHFMLDIYGYKHTLTVRNTYCSFHYNSGCLNAPQCHVGAEFLQADRRTDMTNLTDKSA